MQQGIHPTFHQDATVVCACGVTHNIPGTQKVLNVEICSECHPHYTGKVKIVDTAGRIDRFKARQAAAAAKAKK